MPFFHKTRTKPLEVETHLIAKEKKRAQKGSFRQIIIAFVCQSIHIVTTRAFSRETCTQNLTLATKTVGSNF